MFPTDDSLLFTITSSSNIVVIALNPDVSDDELDSKEFLTFDIIASHPQTTSGKASILISLPVKECPGKFKIQVFIAIYHEQSNF